MPDLLPENIVIALLVLFVVSLVLTILIPAIITFRRFLRNATLEEMEHYRSESPYESIVGSCIGVVLIDILLYIVQRPVLPRRFFYSALACINLMVLSFVAYHLINRLLIRIRTRALSQSA
jgi:hypothetical protein